MIGKIEAIKADDTLSKAEGTPSKELFISMLVKDITLKDAIGDLVDNSVDAANANTKDANDLSGFSVKITLNKNSFEIADNCGGIEEDIARTSAFKLGKPKNYKSGKHTIGQFGIGMKRAIFKLGELITVESIALKSSFKITIDVPKWRDKKDEKDWDFVIDSIEKEKHRLKDTKTIITINELKEDVKKQFADPQFLIDLKNEIALEHLFAINKGLEISINTGRLKAHPITLIYDKDYQPCYWKHEFKSGLRAEVVVGVSEDISEEGGWYIFCNDRLLLGHDTTALTGWSGGKGGKELPKYHDQYFRFRGYVFFNADNSSKLPWNTSKTGLNTDSPDFQHVRAHMITMAKQVKALMDDMKTEREKDNPIGKQKLNNSVKSARVMSVAEVMKHIDKLPAVYRYPRKLLNPVPKTEQKITFSKPLREIQEAMAYFEVDDRHIAGSSAFDYFYNNEIGKK